MNSIQGRLKLVLLASTFIVFAWGCTTSVKTASVASPPGLNPGLQANGTTEKNAERDAESALKEMTESAPKFRLNEYFEAIADAENAAAADKPIKEALKMFVSGDVPVMIVVGETDGNKDYDRPTTISAYLGYVRDQKKNVNDIVSLKKDAKGRITEVELKKIF